MWGYGGEKVMGTVDPKVWDYCLVNRVDLMDLAWGFDEDEPELNEELLPFTPGCWYECDNMAHISGVSRDSGTLQIEDESGKTIFEKSLGDIVGGGCDGEPDWCCNDEVWVGMRKKGEVVFIGSSNEKGTFFEGDIELKAPFDIEKLELHYDEVDGEEIINCVYYDGEEVENYGGSTDGKSSDMNMVRIIDDQGNWERYEVPEEDEVPESACVSETTEDWNPIEELEKIVDEFQMTDWFNIDTHPVHKGMYECEFTSTTWPFPIERMCEWTGRTWKEDGKKAVGIKRWRGLKFDPNAQS